MPIIIFQADLMILNIGKSWEILTMKQKFDGVFVKSQLGIKSTFNLLVKSQPNYIGKKSPFDLLVLSQPYHIGKKSTYDLMVSSQLKLWNKSTD